MFHKTAVLTFITILLISVSSCAQVTPSPELLQWKATGQYFNFKGHKIFYHDTQGSSENTIVMIHGFPTSSWDWRHLWQSMKSDHRIVSLDMLGFGFSDKPKDKVYSIDEQVDLQLALFAELGLKNAHLLVHDYGTYVAEEMLARFNNKETSGITFSIQSLVILNGPVIPEQLQLRLIQKAFNSPLGWIASQFTNHYLFKKNFSPVFGKESQPTEQQLADDWFVISQQQGQKLSYKLIHYYNESIQRRERWLTGIRETTVPVLSISGLADPVAGKPMVDKYVELVPNAKIIALDDIGHYPHVEDAKSVTAHYKIFLDTLTKT